MKRALPIVILLGLLAVALSCGGNSTLNETEAVVFLTANIDQYNPDINIAVPADVTIESMTISSQPKDPNGSLTGNQDVNLERWVITPTRIDGGTTASPQWQVDQHVYVAAGGDASLDNYRVFPAEYFHQTPLSNLLPQNGGADAETGQSNIRQSLQVEIFGTTVSGKSVKCGPFNVSYNFFYSAQ